MAVRIDTLWKRAGFRPNDQQRDAILHTHGPLFLTAGPGSGKTRVLLWRTVNLIVFHEVAPEEIFLGTFTEKAALQLRHGLTGLLSPLCQIRSNREQLAVNPRPQHGEGLWAESSLNRLTRRIPQPRYAHDEFLVGTNASHRTEGVAERPERLKSRDG